ncbi:MAG TPA: hypothetical protein VNW53_07315 [Phenylobacterium sp.]|uniref:hypothetical protein n=1 Tax=Phenylobacterium sp. TaxID=1871053 RepID=UPI002BBA063B|nr:hypothetical protein [Phenylobacterium sp.]HXA38789.1 hypothetical protein [Phenylobacterium sp.]
MLSIAPFRMMRLACAVIVLVCAIVLVSPLSIRNVVLPEDLTVDALTFYGVTAGAYGLLPFVRRADIAIVAMWVVLGVGIAPCFLGQEISASHMFADMAGVLLAAAPVFIARFRQVMQGDVRLYRRREDEAAGFLPAHPGEARDPDGMTPAQVL